MNDLVDRLAVAASQGPSTPAARSAPSQPDHPTLF